MPEVDERKVLRSILRTELFVTGQITAEIRSFVHSKIVIDEKFANDIEPAVKSLQNACSTAKEQLRHRLLA
jgi:hypothetical protein